MKHLAAFIKNETVLFFSALLAVLSMLFVPPSPDYIGYIDLRVLCLLFCLIVTVAGFQKCGLFDQLAQKLLNGRKNLRFLILLLIFLPFFSAMVVTNDVALITFVPFTILVLGKMGKSAFLVPVLVLQTVAANLGSMATPVGNPQNLYLYSFYKLNAGVFFRIMLPVVLLSMLLLSISILFFNKEIVEIDFSYTMPFQGSKRLLLFSILFLLCLLAVFRLFPYPLLTVLVVACLLIFDRQLLLKADYGLIATFICFFILAGNIGHMESIRSVLSSLLERNTFFTSVLTSQFISNVPAAALLSGFTEDYAGLLLGANVGGLGTPVASLASLITLKFYMRTPSARPLSFLGVFLPVNLFFLFILSVLCQWII